MYKNSFRAKNSMYMKGMLLIITTICIFISCAGLGILSGAQSEFDKGLALFNAGKYEAALPRFRRATELDPDFGRAYLYLGRSYLNLDRWSEAVPPLRTAFRLSPDETKKEVINLLVDALFGAAIYEFNKGNFRDSASFLREVIQLEPNSSRARSELARTLIALGGALLSQGKFSDAISTYNEALKFSPNNLDAYIGLANAFLSNGDILKALRTIETVIKIDPTNREAQFLFKEMQVR
ncbi:MAG: tetratricopeptide repeat protein [Deltaproteobacteria bacterium]|nr:tetratricopeptide repeat protein [Deltaproteobacteria bacterium]